MTERKGQPVAERGGQTVTGPGRQTATGSGGQPVADREDDRPVPAFQVRIAVRGYELDPNGHVNQAVYLQYAEHARWEYLRTAGITQDGLLAAGVGPVALENNIRYHAELRAGDEVDVSCVFARANRKFFTMTQVFHRPTGELVAELNGVGGLLDLSRRKLIDEPVEYLRSLASRPELFAG